MALTIPTGDTPVTPRASVALPTGDTPVTPRASVASVALLDPTSERQTTVRQLSARLTTLDGATVGLLDISKPRGNVFLDRLEQRLQELGATTKRYRKPTYTKPAPVDLRHEIARDCTAVIEALAD
jgi:hypothetical protein